MSKLIVLNGITMFKHNNIQMKRDIQEILDHESQAVRNIPINDNYEKAIHLIVDRVHKKGGKVVASGMGKAGQVAHSIGTVFSSTGTPSVFLHPSEAQHGDLGMLAKNDILLLISNSGKTREIIELIHLVDRLYKGIPIIVITSDVESELALSADAVLATGNPKEVCKLGLSPTTSTTVMSVIGDVLVTLLMKEINFSNAEYAKRHHGGYLGQKSRSNIK